MKGGLRFLFPLQDPQCLWSALIKCLFTEWPQQAFRNHPFMLALCQDGHSPYSQ